MVDIFTPALLFALPIGIAFLLPLFEKLGKGMAHAVHAIVVLALIAMTGYWGYDLYNGAAPFEIITGGWDAPYGINLRLGVPEAVLVLMAQVTAFFAALAMNRKDAEDDVRGRVIQLVLLVGAMGLIMTRDLFNTFVFIEITGITTYGLAVLSAEKGALESGFKYMLLGSAASIFLLIGITLIYKTTGSLNIDYIAATMTTLSPEIVSVLGIAFAFTLAAFAAELKLFPVNAPGIDIYEGVNPTVVALLVATSVNGMLYGFYKILGFFPQEWMMPVIVLGLATFVTTNLFANRQTNVRRMFGYSSSGQIGLAVALLPLVHLELVPLHAVGLLVINHTLAKVLLLGLAGLEGKSTLEGWKGAFLNNIPLRLALFTAVLAITGFPPFPGFFGKWEAIVALSTTPAWGIIVPILIGSLLEFGYYYKLIKVVQTPAEELEPKAPAGNTVAPILYSLGLVAAGGVWIWTAYENMLNVSMEIWVLTGGGLALVAIKEIPEMARALAAFAIGVVATYFAYDSGNLGFATVPATFTTMTLGGAVVALLSGVHAEARRKSYHGLFLLLIASVTLLVQDYRFLPFFIGWEVMTWASYAIIGQGKKAQRGAWIYMLFSGAAGFLLLGGMLIAVRAGATTFDDLYLLSGKAANWSWALMIAGVLIKSGAVGVHVWGPDAYAESPDHFTAFLSGVISKVPMLAMMLVLMNFSERFVRYDWLNIDMAHILAWIGALTAFGMTLLAVFQEDVKRVLAYSSLGQVGYIVMGFAMMTPLGWTGALYHSVHHLIFKGLLFLAIAGVVHRTGTRKMYEMGGLIRNMPISYLSVMIGIIALSGVPPLGGFMGKWMLYQAIFEQGWLMLAAFTMFASLMAFLYLYRMIHSIFLGQRKRRHAEIKEAPMSMVAAQVLLWIPIMVLAVWPQVLLVPFNTLTAELLHAPEPLVFTNAMVTPLGTVTNLEIVGPMGTIAPVWVMSIVGVLFVLVLFFMTRVLGKVQKVEQLDIVFSGEMPPPPEEIHFAFDMHKPTERNYTALLVPRVQAFWNEFGDSVDGVAEAGRRFYSGDAQTYILYLVGLAMVLGLTWML